MKFILPNKETQFDFQKQTIIYDKQFQNIQLISKPLGGLTNTVTADKDSKNNNNNNNNTGTTVEQTDKKTGEIVENVDQLQIWIHDMNSLSAIVNSNTYFNLQVYLNCSPIISSTVAAITAQLQSISMTATSPKNRYSTALSPTTATNNILNNNTSSAVESSA